MVIDEEGEFKPTRYDSKVTKTDHNTIIIEMGARKVNSGIEKAYLNTKCPIGLSLFEEKINRIDVDSLFLDVNKMDEDYKKLTQLWNQTMNSSFKKVRRSKKRMKGLDQHVKKLIQEEREIKKTMKDGKDKEDRLGQLQEEISANIVVPLLSLTD